ncbi:hypothetical protein PoB_006047300 [Plakobranchus ocellatus]|uniref:Uncharacterized protein n=1 Tax=Plakobranchus ocellatus TaxID=259542 RepID=A0AAV4CPZ1_9GAST|nr:hypothetical protein PoB_006047300 [Plakobranchus ocellatus]
MHVHIRAIDDIFDNMFNVLCIDIHGYKKYVYPSHLLAPTFWSVQYEWTGRRHHNGCCSKLAIYTTEFKRKSKILCTTFVCWTSRRTEVSPSPRGQEAESTLLMQTFQTECGALLRLIASETSNGLLITEVNLVLTEHATVQTVNDKLLRLVTTSQIRMHVFDPNILRWINHNTIYIADAMIYPESRRLAPAQEEDVKEYTAKKVSTGEIIKRIKK